jgi:microcompartment protein CcmL/EutN
MPYTAAIALLEFGSIAAGIEAGDAMVKRAALDIIHTGTVHPGKYLVLIGGSVGDVEEALDAALMVGSDHVVDRLLLPDPHPQLISALQGNREPGQGEALGIIETVSVAASIRAADAGLKGALVTLREIFLADGLGGKGYLLFGGPLVEVEAAVDYGTARAQGAVVGSRVIAQLHSEMDENLVADGRFAARVRTS